MSTAAQKNHRFTRDEYERLVENGAFGPEDRVELVEGIIYDMTPQNSRHATALRLAQRALDSAFGSGHDVRAQLPLALGEKSLPEPDIAVVPGDPRDYRDSHPTSAVLVIEVADSSAQHDRARKARLYALSGIPEFWILNVTDRVLEVHRNPVLDSYRYRKVLRSNETVSPLSCPQATLRVEDLLP
jgi:Uma2 family endonuclease